MDAANRPVKTYSGGMRRRLDLAASIVARPDILFLDEPTTGLDPRTRKDMWDTIQELVDGGTTLLLTTQYLEEADFLADKIAVMDQGKVIAQGTPADLKRELADDFIELRVEDDENIDRALQVLANIGQGEPFRKADMVIIPVHNGAYAIADVVRKLDNESIQIADVSLRQPSLDDVFLSLTGAPAEDDTEEDDRPTGLSRHNQLQFINCTIARTHNGDSNYGTIHTSRRRRPTHHDPTH